MPRNARDYQARTARAGNASDALRIELDRQATLIGTQYREVVESDDDGYPVRLRPAATPAATPPPSAARPAAQPQRRGNQTAAPPAQQSGGGRYRGQTITRANLPEAARRLSMSPAEAEQFLRREGATIQ